MVERKRLPILQSNLRKDEDAYPMDHGEVSLLSPPSSLFPQI